MDPDALSPMTSFTIDPGHAARLAEIAPENDGPVWMVHLMRHRRRSGHTDDGGTGRDGRAAGGASTPLGPYREVGGQLVFLSDVEAQLVGDDHEWERAAVVRYPTRRSFLAVQELPGDVALHEHEGAGMEASLVLCCVPADWPAVPDGAPRPFDVPYPSTPDDGPVVLLHVVRYLGERRTGDLDVYRGAAGRSALPHGVRIGAWLDVEGTVVGDGRVWDEVRFHVFPSRAAFEAVAFDAGRIAALADCPEPAIADVHTLVLRPVMDRLAASIRS